MHNDNLPMQLTSLLGREQETAILHKLLCQPEVRLVTITGPGGVGKTSLALQVAFDVQDAFVDGVFFISLAAITDSTLIIPTIAQTLGVIESPNRLLLDSLKEFLRERQALLLLDNFEQIISAAPLLTELLSACADLRMLVTSREALRLRGEHEFPLSPLALPDQSSVEALLQYPGIALFIQRAQAIQPEFQLAHGNAPAVAEICARLDGLPLAIELAAARIKLLSPQAMLVRLKDSSLGLLTSGARDLPVRQQTLHSTIQWSYDLLNADEQRAFRWLSVFVGGCALEAASIATSDQSTVIGDKEQATDHWSLITLDLVTSLVNKSLLRQSETDSEPRLTMLETIREFGWEQLTRTHELEDARRTHANYYLSFVEEAETYLTGADQKTWLKRLNREQDNLRAALQWALEHHEGEMAQRMAGALQPFWLTRGHWSEGRRWLEESLAMDSGATLAPAVRAKTLYAAGMLTRFEFARARMLLEASLTLYRALAGKTGVLMALVELSRITAYQDDQTAKKAFLAEAASLLETLPDTVVKASAYSDLALIMEDLGASQYPPETARYLAESERIQRALNNPTGLALALTRQASGALFEGEFTLMASRLDEAERLALELGDERILGRLAGIRVLHAVQEGDFAAMRLRLLDSLQQSVNRGNHQVPFWLPILAAVLHGQGLDVWSARVFGLADTLPETIQLRAYAAAFKQRFHISDARAQVRAQLGDEAFEREIAAGHRLRMEDLRTIPHPLETAPPSTSSGQPASSSASSESLTAREIEVLRLLAQDLSNPQIAEQLVVSRRTVDAHLRSIYDKLGVKSRDAAIRMARERGLI
ncbi:MAG: LuxR C-terminal-related transcriptional regulator [Anaerolineae bacterium]|nr:LuxR C-terminal-related transcriptional regulator [Anaerolineae bacterium]